MSAISVKFVHRVSKQRKDGRAPIWLRLSARGKSRYTSTGILIDPKHWNEDRQEVRKSHENSTTFNERLRRLRVEAEQAALEADTASEAMSQISSDGGTFTEYFENYISKLRRRDQYWERKKYETTLRKLQASFGNHDIDWLELTRPSIRDFHSYCAEERGNNPNTIRKELERVRRVVREAVRDEIIKPGDNPFILYDLPKAIPPDRRKLTISEINSLESVSISDINVQTARDAFILAFYAGGMRFGDICRLLPEMVENSRLRYRMMKTDQFIDLRLPPRAIEIINSRADSGPYVFPFLSAGDENDPVHLRQRIQVANVMVNRHLKTACEQAGISNPDDVTFHVARHSFADHARRKSGDVYAVSKALGHSNLKVTENYLASFDTEATDRLTDTLWDE